MSFVLGADIVNAVSNYEMVNVTFTKYVNMFFIKTNFCHTRTQFARKHVRVSQLVIITTCVCMYAHVSCINVVFMCTRMCPVHDVDKWCE